MSAKNLFVSVGSIPSSAYAFTNLIYLNPADYSSLVDICPPSSDVDQASSGVLVQVRNMVFAVKPLDSMANNKVGMNMLQRRAARLPLDEQVALAPFTPPLEDFYISTLTLEVDTLKKKRDQKALPIDASALADEIKLRFVNQVFSSNQELCIDFNSPESGKVILKLRVRSIENAHLRQDVGSGEAKAAAGGGDEQAMQTSEAGQLLRVSQVSLRKAEGAVVRLTNAAGTTQSANSVLNLDFLSLGIGGLNREFADIFRRAFASRIFPPAVVAGMGINHVRGMLLYGPPGCGKTLIARQIGKVLNAREPKIVSGPSIMDRYVGASEQNIRELFADAEAEQAEAGDDSELHIIIFDELDAICKSRGSTRDGTGVHDSVVNQLLAKIDGVDALNNILIIGMTNRKDMLDSALLRPGRLEVHIEIGLPDEAGRSQILAIHTGKMKESGYLSPAVTRNIPDLARRTKNFSGAEIEGLVKSAASFAFQRQVSARDLSKPVNAEELKIEMGDFDHALSEVQPAFGVQRDELALCFRNGIIDYGDQFGRLRSTLQRLVEQVRSSDKTPLLSALLSGPPGCGKSALAAKLAASSGFPFVKVISADALIGYSESSKCSTIAKIFDDSYKSPLSLIIIDDIERVIDYVRLGPRFSNLVLQALLVLIKKAPPTEGRRLLLLGTTSVPGLMADLGLTSVFNVSLDVPMLETPEDMAAVLAATSGIVEGDGDSIASALTKPLGIKKLLMVLEMARAADGSLSYASFMECLLNTGY